jgi:APA family basic amino acid/polyamine antiporter
MTGSYEKIAHYTILCEWSFYLLVVVGLVPLRRKRPDHPRPYKMWGYPLTPMSFAAVTLWALISTSSEALRCRCLDSLSTIAGIRAYFFVRRFGLLRKALCLTTAVHFR